MVVYIVVGAVLTLLVAMLYSVKELPAFCAFCSGAAGVFVLWATSLIGSGIGLNPFTCGVCAVLGVPGAVGLLGVKFMLGI